MNKVVLEKTGVDMQEKQLVALAEEFLDLWEENIRLWAEEKDLFTLRSLLENLGQGDRLGEDPEENPEENPGENSDKNAALEVRETPLAP
ncbi:MAG: hypothetical protein JKY34_13840 [Kordiimonadaceae bacterium]|nr:hypothetical protein [Kordiimonadaceae bacterium]